MLKDFLYSLDALMTAWLDIKYFIFVYWIREKSCLIILCFVCWFLNFWCEPNLLVLKIYLTFTLKTTFESWVFCLALYQSESFFLPFLPIDILNELFQLLGYFFLKSIYWIIVLNVRSVTLFYFLKDSDNTLFFLCLQFLLFSFCPFCFFIDAIFFFLLITPSLPYFLLVCTF